MSLGLISRFIPLLGFNEVKPVSRSAWENL
jgi:hypothetical protein